MAEKHRREARSLKPTFSFKKRTEMRLLSLNVRLRKEGNKKREKIRRVADSIYSATRKRLTKEKDVHDPEMVSRLSRNGSGRSKRKRVACAGFWPLKTESEKTREVMDQHYYNARKIKQINREKKRRGGNVGTEGTGKDLTILLGDLSRSQVKSRSFCFGRIPKKNSEEGSPLRHKPSTELIEGIKNFAEPPPCRLVRGPEKG